MKPNNILNDRVVVLEGVNEAGGTIIEKLQQEKDNLKNELKFVKKTAEKSHIVPSHPWVDGMESEDTDQVCLDIVNEVAIPLSLFGVERSHRIVPKNAKATRNTEQERLP